MSDDKKTGLDALDAGPISSDTADGPNTASTGDPQDHVTVAALLEAYPAAVQRTAVNAGDQHVVWIDPEKSFEILTWLKTDADQLYDMMSDVTGVDYGGGRPVEVVYQMYSSVHKHALRIRCPLPLDAMSIPSVVGLWKSADWLEREVYDLFGVVFEGHPDLRRILMPDDYTEGHPLRKDFPLRGRLTRAEQTMNALNQDVERFYQSEDLGGPGHIPQEVPAVEVGTHEGEG